MKDKKVEYFNYLITNLKLILKELLEYKVMDVRNKFTLYLFFFHSMN
jgi:hypothetical protein